jgi:hypothetical protein
MSKKKVTLEDKLDDIIEAGKELQACREAQKLLKDKSFSWSISACDDNDCTTVTVNTEQASVLLDDIEIKLVEQLFDLGFDVDATA